jgi:hypothetical protein
MRRGGGDEMAHIDWVTLVGRRSVDENDCSVYAAYKSAVEDAMDRQPTFISIFGFPPEWQIVKPRAPYSFARRSDDCSRTLYIHPLAAHYTLEIAGTHCKKVTPAQWVDTCLHWAGCFSRLDIAVDMACTVTPRQFAAAIKETPVKTRSEFVSSTGETVYLGSRTSERYARVYRYNEPHPRAKLLRAEFQLKGVYANEAALRLTEGEALNGIAAALGDHFGFAHEVWKTDDEPVPLKVKSHAQTGNTVFWLTNTVAPLLKRLNEAGKLDAAAWFDEYVMKT